MEWDPVHIAFLFFAGMTLIAAVALSVSRKIIQAAFLLFGILFGMAALFVFARAPFLALAQIIIYLGGILILILFGVMLTNKSFGKEAVSQLRSPIPALLVAGLLVAMLFQWLYPLTSSPLPWMEQTANLEAGIDTTEILGAQLLSTYLLPFEFVSVLLLIALIGAAFIARQDSTE